MTPIKFPECNITYAENQPEYHPLPGFKADGPQGEFVFCHQLNWKERLKILFTGKLWVCLLTFNKPLTPSFHTVYKKEVITTA